ncbi:MAG: Trm112 family protein [Planctomycetota bacterium]
MIDAEVLKVLACPYCVTRPLNSKSTLAGGSLALRGPADAPTGLHCTDCNRTYPLDKDGIPHLLIDSATVEKKA